MAELNDPGAGLATEQERRDARVAVWRSAYEGYSDEDKEDAARAALEDLYEPVCLLSVVRALSGQPNMSPSQAAEWAEDRLRFLLHDEVLNILSMICDAPTDWTPEPDDQGETINKIVVISGEAYADGVRQTIPILPRIGNVAPIAWGPLAEGSCIVKAEPRRACYASQHDFHGAHLHLLEAMVLAEGVQERFDLVDSLADVQWEAK